MRLAIVLALTASTLAPFCALAGERTDLYREGIERLIPRAEQGSAAAQFMLGLLYTHPPPDAYGHRPPLPPEDVLAGARWLAAAEAQGYGPAVLFARSRENPEAAYAIALMFLDEVTGIEDSNEGLLYMKQAAEAGHAEAQFQLGRAYLGRETGLDVRAISLMCGGRPLIVCSVPRPGSD